jgi:hypothetical protein
VRLLTNTPVTVPSVVLVARAVVGFIAVDQQIPLVVTVPPPFDVMFPPETAVVVVIDVAAAVVSVGTTIAVVVNVCSLP